MEKFKEGQKLTVISLNKTVFAVEYLPDELHLNVGGWKIIMI